MIHIVDDDQAVRQAVSLVLEVAGWRARAYPDAQSFLDAFVPTQPGCLILDVKMPGIDGLGLQEMLTRSDLSIPIIFITGHGDVPMSVRAIKAGAVDFLEKPFRNEQLLDRVEEAVQEDLHNHAHQARAMEVRRRYENLTPREREVMAMVVQGKSNKLIAYEMALSHRTVEIHRGRVMEKMGATSLPDLVAMAVVCGVHELD